MANPHAQDGSNTPSRAISDLRGWHRRIISASTPSSQISAPHTALGRPADHFLRNVSSSTYEARLDQFAAQEDDYDACYGELAETLPSLQFAISSARALLTTIVHGPNTGNRTHYIDLLQDLVVDQEEAHRLSVRMSRGCESLRGIAQRMLDTVDTILPTYTQTAHDMAGHIPLPSLAVLGRNGPAIATAP
jgi:hypothetical protein